MTTDESRSTDKQRAVEVQVNTVQETTWADEIKFFKQTAFKVLQFIGWALVATITHTVMAFALEHSILSLLICWRRTGFTSRAIAQQNSRNKTQKTNETNSFALVLTRILIFFRLNTYQTPIFFTLCTKSLERECSIADKNRRQMSSLTFFVPFYFTVIQLVFNQKQSLTHETLVLLPLFKCCAL